MRLEKPFRNASVAATLMKLGFLVIGELCGTDRKYDVRATVLAFTSEHFIDESTICRLIAEELNLAGLVGSRKIRDGLLK